MIKPPNFDGAKFAAKYNLDPFKDFYDNGKGEIICPSLPNLVDADLLDCLPDPPPDKEIFSLPIQAPAIYADDVFVSSRDINHDADAAFAEAIQETQKSKGQPKSLDLISRSTLKALEKARREIDELKAAVNELEKTVKKLEK